ncbi:MAG: cystathionine beta-lyase [Alphaproteobacteria bacterium]|nr:MAG: cystathionine beta-lyase [Alphaproteobacteria bacterium]
MKRDTRLVEGGRRKDWTHGIVNPPIFRASTCLFESYAALRAGIANPDADLFYGRRGTPTHWALREALRELEGGAGTWLYPSGMAAITASILAFARAGDRILVTDSAYEPTRHFCDTVLKAMDIETVYYDPLIGADIAGLLDARTRLVLTESPGSLSFEVQDLPAIAASAHAAGALVLLDNTWATPLHLDALALGADVSIHAATKYIVGHSDVMLGTATANDRAWPRLKRMATALGLTVSADDAWLALRGLRTLGVRLARHETNAIEIANWLKARPEVARVLHPALPDCPGHDIFRRDFTGSCGLFSIVMRGGDEDAIAAFIDGLEHFGIGFSWGGYESLILPADPARVRSATRWQAEGPLLRLHIGLEDPADLITDLEAGLARFRRAGGG